MKKTLLILSLLVAPLSAMYAQRVVTDNFDLLEVHYQTPTLTVETVPFYGEKSDLLQLVGYHQGGEEGSPVLPVSIELITIPFCNDVVVEVSNAVYDTLDLGLQSIYPLQPSRSKSDTVAHDPVINSERYATDAFWGLPLASVEVIGVARDRRLANLSFSPVQVNPVTGQVVVCRSADVVVRYIGSDEQATRDHFNRYYTPAFSAGNTLNNLVSLKDVNRHSPIHMVVVIPPSLTCSGLDRFVEWKRSQGLLVSTIVTYGMDNNAVADSLKSLYTNATDDHPAPAYLILVGDHAQTSAFSSQFSYSSMNDHITDLYYVTWTTGDKIPDCYQGRFSAGDTNTLNNIISKTLLYEQYAFSNDDYLARAALVAGEDNGSHQTSGYLLDHAWKYCDPNMDYLAKTYFNAENGYDTVSYYKNNIDFAPEGVHVTGYCSNSSSATALRNFYSQGVGFISYSAHGDWDRWHKPLFTNNHVSSLVNNGKPSVMIGNCCLTNKFDKASCFGESLLRKNNNAGAVVYIGGTNSTLWDEDFYWSVGVRSNVSNEMNTNYVANKLGAIDRLFHTHNEAFNKYAVTAGSIVMAGNMAVNNSTSSFKVYYWEIYELMGDPSLLPWLGKASDLTVSASHGDNTLQVNTVPFSYVAVVDTTHLHVIDAGFTDENGQVSLSVAGENASYSLSVTAQGYKPFHKAISELNVGIDDVQASDAKLQLYPNPATDRCTVAGENVQRVDVLDLTGRTLLSVNHPTTLDLSSLQGGLYLVRISTPAETTVRKLIINK